jgi:hypothetical protein
MILAATERTEFNSEGSRRTATRVRERSLTRRQSQRPSLSVSRFVRFPRRQNTDRSIYRCTSRASEGHGSSLTLRKNDSFNTRVWTFSGNCICPIEVVVSFPCLPSARRGFGICGRVARRERRGCDARYSRRVDPFWSRCAGRDRLCFRPQGTCSLAYGAGTVADAGNRVWRSVCRMKKKPKKAQRGGAATKVAQAEWPQKGAKNRRANDAPMRLPAFALRATARLHEYRRA